MFREVPFGMDGDFSKQAIIHRINGDLANDFGNLASRSVTMISKFLKGRIERPEIKNSADDVFESGIRQHITDYYRSMEVFSFYKALQSVFDIISIMNRYIDIEAPWRLAKEGDVRVKTVMYNLWNGLRIAALLLSPFMPEKSQKIWEALGIKNPIEATRFEDEEGFYYREDISEITRISPIFPRIEG